MTMQASSSPPAPATLSGGGIMKSKRFSASSAAQLIACPGSANLHLALPGWEAPVRDDMAGAKGVGTRVHAVLEPFHQWPPPRLYTVSRIVLQFSKLHITKRHAICDDVIKATDFVRAFLLTSPTTTILTLADWLVQLKEFTPKMLRFISDAAVYMSELIATVIVSDAVVSAEENLIAEWLPSKPGTTPDVTIVSPTRLEVIDYKSGAIPVSPVDNDQLMFYAACKLHLAPLATEFTCHILQPGNLASWTTDISHLKRWMNLAIDADRRIMRKDLTLRPNDHCTFCPANPHTRGDKGNVMCPAMMNKLYPPVIDEDEIFAVI